MFVGTILFVGACVQLAGIDDPHPKPGGEAGGGGGGTGGSPNVEKDAGPDAVPDAPPGANDDAAANPVDDPEWANWRMPNPVATGLPNPADYSINTGQGIVVDNVTKLTWRRDAGSDAVTWDVATNYCNGLEFAGYSDWRLPTAIELISLVDFTKPTSEPTIDEIAFPMTPADWFWTATPLANMANSVWIVSFGTGDTSANNVGGKFRMRCVR